MGKKRSAEPVVSAEGVAAENGDSGEEGEASRKRQALELSADGAAGSAEAGSCAQEEVKEEAKEEAKEVAMAEPTEEVKEEAKEEAPAEPTAEPTEEVKEEAKEEATEEPAEVPAEVPQEVPKEEPLSTLSPFTMSVAMRVNECELAGRRAALAAAVDAAVSAAVAEFGAQESRVEWTRAGPSEDTLQRVLPFVLKLVRPDRRAQCFQVCKTPRAASANGYPRGAQNNPIPGWQRPPNPQPPRLGRPSGLSREGGP